MSLPRRDAIPPVAADPARVQRLRRILGSTPRPFVLESDAKAVIAKAENREEFKQAMEKIGLEVCRGETVRTVTAQVRPAGSSVVLRVAASRTQISLAAMPSPGQGRVYEVWTKRGAGAPRATSALFGVTRAGTASTAITAGSAGTSEVLISSEPVGGSSSPTRAPVVVARL